MKHTNILTIDGPSGSGKSTVAKQISRALKCSCLNSGSLYRIIALYAIENNLLDNMPALAADMPNINIKFVFENNICSTLLQDQDVTAEIRQERIGNSASQISAVPEIRTNLVNLQRSIVGHDLFVVEGRDMGTVIFPEAKLKIFLTASLEKRAERRFLELKNKHNDISLNKVISDMSRRDKRDTSRDIAPLIPAKDSINIDSSYLNAQDIVAKILLLWQNS
jgi:CMP/dCMP kinase